MKTGVEQDNLQVLMDLLAEAREEADKLREKVEKYENALLSTKLLMGHELKKPTTALTGYLDLALDSLDRSRGKWNEQAEEIIDCLGKARKECELLSELNMVFITLLRINGEKENLPVEKIAIEELFKEILAAFPERYDAFRRVMITVSPNIKHINFNKNALMVIVSNLMENSLLYSSEKEQVFVEVDAVTDQRQMSNRELMRMTVRDTGMGVPEEYLQKIFSPFVRLQKDKAEGSGLGLTLVRSLVELYGGEVSVNSESGRGTTIFITIPMITEQREHMVL